mmetsp:Transcript_14890/g.62776  ORF Transcript_14890/g.62776 Transcript_14890/m.62776 type:complete len:201 (+) Transcript_14890:292-894(+)
MVWRNQGFHPSTKSAGVASASSFPPPLFAAKSAPVHFLSRGFLICRVASLVSAAPTTTADDATANSRRPLPTPARNLLPKRIFCFCFFFPSFSVASADSLALPLRMAESKLSRRHLLEGGVWNPTGSGDAAATSTDPSTFSSASSRFAPSSTRGGSTATSSKATSSTATSSTAWTCETPPTSLGVLFSTATTAVPLSRSA